MKDKKQTYFNLPTKKGNSKGFTNYSLLPKWILYDFGCSTSWNCLIQHAGALAEMKRRQELKGEMKIVSFSDHVVISMVFLEVFYTKKCYFYSSHYLTWLYLTSFPLLRLGRQHYMPTGINGPWTRGAKVTNFKHLFIYNSKFSFRAKA